MNTITQAGNDSRSVDKRQKVIIDFSEDLNLWRELKLARSPGRLFHSVITRSEKNFHRDVQLLNCWYFTWLVMAACGRLRFFLAHVHRIVSHPIMRRCYRRRRYSCIVIITPVCQVSTAARGRRAPPRHSQYR